MEPKRKLKAGVIGAGGIGRVHIDALRRIGVDVVALTASNAARSKVLADALGVPRACRDSDELVQQQDIDVVHICSPNAFHVAQARQALQAGKHVVCEKPLAPTAVEAAELWALAQGSGLIHAVAYNYRFYSMVRAMRAAVAEGHLGRVHLIRGCYLLDEILLIEDPASWLLDPVRRGSALSLADVGVHWWDLVEHVSGQRIESVLCSRQAVRAADVVGEDSAALMLRLSGGSTAVAAISGAAPGHSNTIQLELIGTEASMWWEQENPDQLWCGTLGRPAERTMRPAQPKGVPMPPTLQMPAGHVAGYLDAFRDLIASVYEAINGGAGRDFPSFADGARGVAVLDALVRSADEDRWTEVPQ